MAPKSTSFEEERAPQGQPKSQSGTTITDIKCYVVEEKDKAPRFNWRKGVPGGFGDGTPAELTPRYAYIRVDTACGVVGSLRMNRGDSVASLVQRRLKPLVGQDALMTEHLWRLVWEIDRIEEFQINQFGMLDMIAWDIKSKIAGLPLYQLLGGFQKRVPAYASTATWNSFDEYERHIKLCADLGFTSFKLHAWGDPKDDAELCRRLRKWAGDDAVLTFDGSGAWAFEESLQFGRILEELNFYWYEEPMREFDLYSYKKLCEKLDVAVLAAETSDGSHWNAATWIQTGALDMVRTSTFLKGGITGAIKIAHLAESHGMKAQVHGLGSAQAQLAAAIPNNDFYEQIVYDENQITALETQAEVPVINGFIEASDEPGIGFDPDWSWIERNAISVV